ncbi:hypothetical protein OG905_23645 [Streptomyces sp. NBC_00322]|uniref:hypothetical protein n=1 Tax=Streptomyces sp. NBC_00322 TaxID=2975712 RepID=UPI002E27D9E7|nr:hypothetical protein [Streptomyces sp. NBC_00322]
MSAGTRLPAGAARLSCSALLQVVGRVRVSARLRLPSLAQTLGVEVYRLFNNG